MSRQIPLLIVAVLSIAGCQSNPTPLASGSDAMGNQVYSLGAGRLSELEITANSNCFGVTRPYYKSVTGSGENVNVTYTCE